MKHQRLIALVLALPATSWAQDPATQLDPERVRTLLIADASDRSKVELRLEFQEEVRFQSPRETRTQEQLAVHVKLNGTLRAGSSYQLQTGGAQTSLLIEHGDMRYDAVRAPGETWLSSTKPRGESRTRFVGLVGVLRYPVLDQVTWAEFLERYPIVEASMEGDQLTVFFAFDSTIAGWIKKRALDAIGGCVGWRCVLCKSGERFRLTQVETIVTTYRLVADPAGGVKRVPHDDYVAKRGRRRINGMDEFGVFRYVDFEQFKALAGFDLPMRVVDGGTESIMTAEIDPLTLNEDVTFKDDDFAFRPPRSFGDRGIHTDKKKGTTTYFGEFDGGSDGLVNGLIEGARRLGAREPPTDTRALWWILGIGGVLTGLALLAWRRHGPDRATRSPA